jgi:hypothetical protein
MAEAMPHLLCDPTRPEGLDMWPGSSSGPTELRREMVERCPDTEGEKRWDGQRHVYFSVANKPLPEAGLWPEGAPSPVATI